MREQKILFTLRYWLLAAFLGFFSCKRSVDSLPAEKLFTKVPVAISGVTFENRILESEQLHYYRYLYLYIGGGVAAADFNNDGLEDLFFTSNIYHNKLFLNKGDFRFEDITPNSGIKKRPGFDTGVTVADINQDGFLDIYITRAGWFEDEEKLANMLYINNGDLTFTEKAAEYGLADTDRSIAATFFDYDRDGDLDLYVANAPSTFGLSSKVLKLKTVQQDPKTLMMKGSDKLYRNNGKGRFMDVSASAGILPELGFGLHSQVGDLNGDGWMDIFVSNDFIGPDFAYINNGDGTFREGRNGMFKHLSYYSMGSDIGDINNDGLNDLVVLDMNPEDHIRSKTTMSMMPMERFHDMVANDHHQQYMHNVLQLNNGNGTFSEIGYLAGIAKTDWSWASLLADFDLDGLNDLYVTNGIYRDVVDRDANQKIEARIRKKGSSLKESDYYHFTRSLPQQKLTNYFFGNRGDLTFKDRTREWADQTPTFSNGATYADLDNDGDLDLVVNNIDENATVLKNNARELYGNNYLQLHLKGSPQNLNGIGSKIEIQLQNGDIQVREMINSRGYLSSVPNTLYFGLGSENTVSKIKITWPDGSSQTVENVPINKKHTLYHTNAKAPSPKSTVDSTKLFKEVHLETVHKEIPFDDFTKQLLLPHKLSQRGPALALADVNGDGHGDVYLGGGHQEAGQLLLGQPDRSFKPAPLPCFMEDRDFEDVAASFFDADGDGDMDLYVGSGSYEFAEDSPMLTDRLYLNTGTGSFDRAPFDLPKIRNDTSVIVPADYDGDGDIDLYVGSGSIPGRYPFAPESYLLINNKGKFERGNHRFESQSHRPGMVRAAVWDDMDRDGDLDLIVTGEWMGIMVYTNTNGKLSQDSQYEHLSKAIGWWNSLLIADLDGDRNKDIVAGNLGLNYKFKASKEKPFHIYAQDFDQNGVEDIILANHYKGKQVPVRGKSCTTQQLPFLKERIKSYGEFARSDISQIFGENITSSYHLEANEFRSGIFMNQERGNFKFVPFPNQAQIAPINSILYHDFDGDGTNDLLMGGNNHMAEVETTRADAGTGIYLRGEEKGTFVHVPNMETGFFANGDLRNMVLLKIKKEVQGVFVANNNGPLQYFVINESTPHQ